MHKFLLFRVSRCIIFGVTLSLIIVAGCQTRNSHYANSTPMPTPDLSEMKSIENLDSAIESKKSIAKKDLRFLAVGGIGAEVLGVEEGIANPFVEKYGYRIIKGTSDVIQSQEQGRLDNVARRYTKSYNKALLNHLTQQKSKSENP